MLARGFKLDPKRPPFPGIHAFEAEDAAIYFGRDDETRAVIERLDARRTQGGARFLVIIGASGSGKSSLLKAGVLPQLSRRRREWVVLPYIRPEKTHPLDFREGSVWLARGTDLRDPRDQGLSDTTPRAQTGQGASADGSICCAGCVPIVCCPQAAQPRAS